MMMENSSCRMASSASSAITTSIASETTSLLQQQQCQQRTSFTAAGDDHARRGRDKKEGGRSTGNSSCMYYVFLFTACAAVVVGSAVLLLSFMGTTTTTSSSTSSVSILANNIPATKELLPLPLPPLIPATTDTLTNNNITFGGLAQRMVPPAVAAMWDAVRATLTETVRPQDVYQTRQRLLTARNLLDVFSPVYPNATTRRTTTTTMDATDDATTANAKHASATTTVDAWSLLRAYLDTGYSLVGEFLDLYHANVTYTERQMEAVRQTVLDWKNHEQQQTGFFSSSSSCNTSSSTADASHHHHHRRHDARNNCFNVSLFLMTTMTTPLGSSSSSSGGFTHDKASRLFWKHYGDGDTGEQQQQQQQQRFFVALPQSDDGATTSLRALGCKQLALALHYYRRMYQHETILETTAGHADHTDGSSNNNSNKTDDDSNNAAHEDYHDLRKVLRSLVNEYNLFRKNILGATKSNVMFPDGLKTKAAIGVLNTARGLLGDLNDDWTAYMFYKAHDNDHNKHHQKRSTRRIHNHGSQKKLAEEIERRWKEFKRWSIEVDLQGTLQSLLAGMSSSSSTQQDRPTRHFVIGNQAGDTDSIVSSIALAYIESAGALHGVAEVTPVISIPRRDFETQRPETALLLKLAGISNASEELIFVDSPFITWDGGSDVSRGANVTLVDHNRLEDKFRDKQWTVVEIVDHHFDEEQYLDTCSGKSRFIAFENGQAMVASASTLVAERMKKLWTPLPYPASLGILLLGTILLDSVNMDPAAGKFTDRDGDSVRDILYNTAWSILDKETKQILNVSERPDTDAFYHALESARFDLGFWRSLSMHDALRLDYKRYAYESNGFGVSAVLMPYQEFVRETNLVEGIRAYMLQEQVNFLGIMLTSMDGNVFQRQLALCAFDSFPLRDMVQFLLQTDDHEQEVLGLVELDESMITEDGLTIRFFDQSNAKASRKQIAPSLLEFFAQSSI